MADELFQEPENATPLTPEERAELIPAHIAYRAELNASEQENIARGQDWALARKRDLLSEKFIKDLHARMLGDVWRWAGKYRTTERNLGIDLADRPPPNTAVDQRLARVSALAAIATIFAAVAYSRESGFAVYAALFAIPYVVFGLGRSSKKWQAWGTALAWGMIALSLAAAAFPAFSTLRRAHRSQIAALVVLIALLITQVAQLIFVRRAVPGKIAFGRRVFRILLYYACSLLVLAATLPNWYVPPIVRRETQAMEGLREYSAAMQAYVKMSKDGSYPPRLSALATSINAGKLAFSAVDSELLCAQVSCIRNGYRFQYRPIFHEKRVASYTISARPVEFEETGRYSFLLTSDGRICWTREDREAVLTDSNR